MARREKKDKKRMSTCLITFAALEIIKLFMFSFHSYRKTPAQQAEVRAYYLKKAEDKKLAAEAKKAVQA
jgi:hypothetical protein